MEYTENNKLIAEFMGLGYNLVVSDKKVTVIGKKGTPLKLHCSSSGYLNVNCSNKGKQKSFRLHRLVASAYVDNPENKPEVNHKDGNKLNNLPNNLEWVTRSENIKHGINTGLIPKSMVNRAGKKHWGSKPIEVFDVKGNLLYEFESAGEAERNGNFNRKSIHDAISGRLKTYKGFIWKYKNN